jgi:hypothetical protein
LVFIARVRAERQSPPPDPGSPTPRSTPRSTTLTSQSALVVVPALVRDKSKGGQLVFTLTADDFQLTDDGIPQKLHLEEDTGGEPLALVVDIEGGGAGVQRTRQVLGSLADDAGLCSSAALPHKIAVVGLRQLARAGQDFHPQHRSAVQTDPGAHRRRQRRRGAATLDSLRLLASTSCASSLIGIPPRHPAADQPRSNDRGSKLKLDDALHAISDTNTAIYSIGFSSGKPRWAARSRSSRSRTNPAQRTVA